MCYPSSTVNCCYCSDQRPITDDNKYPMYVDGEGFQDYATRNEFYCHVCNPKNYDAWREKIARDHDLKQEIRKQTEILTSGYLKALENDHIRAAQLKTTEEIVEFHYSNGDYFKGRMQNGLRHGIGRMLYTDGSTYEGNWVNDKQEGYGKRDWLDEIVYIGEWRNNMMDGLGTHTMADGNTKSLLYKQYIDFIYFLRYGYQRNFQRRYIY